MKYLWQYLRVLLVLWQIKSAPRETRRKLFWKSARLFLSLLAFTDRSRPQKQLYRAMNAAELTAVYDFDTDWMPISRLRDSVYLNHLRRYVENVGIRYPAMKLFARDLSGTLSPDGLERGSVALTFYIGLIGSDWPKCYSPEKINEFGRSLQIIDDATDLVKDRLNGDKNCLLRERRHLYLAEGQAFVSGDFFTRLQQNSVVYRYFLRNKWTAVYDGLRIHRKDATMRKSDGKPFDAEIATQAMEEIKAHMMTTRPEKYGPWFAGIERFKTIARVSGKVSFVPGFRYFDDADIRAKGTEAVYSAARHADDVADGDAAVPPGFSSALEFLGYLTRVLYGQEAPREATGKLFMYGLSLLQEAGADLTLHMLDILAALRFDAMRRSRSELVVLDREQIDHYVDRRDINGTIGGCLLVTRERAVTIDDIAPLGYATQIRYTIRDLRADVLQRMFNIPREDVQKFGIYIPDPSSEVAVRAWSDSLPVRRWCHAEAKRANALLEEYRGRKTELLMHPYTRSVLYLAYERPADLYVRETLRAA